MKNASTELATLELIDRLLNQLNARKIPTNLYLDFLTHLIVLAMIYYLISYDTMESLMDPYNC